MTDTQTLEMEKIDIYSSVTQKIISFLDKGEMPWRKPWSSGKGKVHRPLRVNDIPYTGINTVVLWTAGMEKEYTSPYWMTFRQAEELQAHVRTGEVGTQIVFTEKITKAEEDENGDLQEKITSVLKTYSVFNANQIEGLPEHFYQMPSEKLTAKARIKKVEQFFKGTEAEIYTGVKAAYNQGVDRIEMPPFENFRDAIKYYGTLAHEVTHWTKHPSRLNRDFNSKRFADQGYAMEELVAELGACFLAADLGYEPVIRQEHAAYIQGWLKALKQDNRFVFQAASHAQKAVEYMTSLQPEKKQTVENIFKPAPV